MSMSENQFGFTSGKFTFEPSFCVKTCQERKRIEKYLHYLYYGIYLEIPRAETRGMFYEKKSTKNLY